MAAPVIDAPVPGTVDALIAREAQVFLDRQPRSTELIAKAREHLAGSATSNWQIAEPQAVWMSHAGVPRSSTSTAPSTSTCTAATGVSIAGHAHPAIVAAVTERVSRGTHFAQPTEDAIWITSELSRH